MAALKKAVKAHSGPFDSVQPNAQSGRRWPWPRAVLTIIVLSLMLWGGAAAIALLAFN